MDDQRTGERPALRLIDLRDRVCIERICAQSIDGFGRKSNQAASANDASCAFNRFRLRLYNHALVGKFVLAVAGGFARFLPDEIRV